MMTYVQPKKWPTLDEAKRQLQDSLARADAPPVLGYHDIPIGEQAKAELRELIDGSDDRVENAFQYAPLVTSWAIAHDLRHKYGEEKEHAYYPIIAATLGLDPGLPTAVTADIRKRFRSACARLGLPLPPIGYEPDKELKYEQGDVFFAQAGVSVSKLELQTSIFNRACREMGDPPQHSTAALVRWQHDAVQEFASPQQRRLRKILLHDTTGFHAGLFARLANGEHPVGDVERAVSEAIAAMPREALSSAARPEVRYSNGDLAVVDSRGRNAIQVNDRNRWRHVEPRRQLRLIAPWPETVTWRSVQADDHEKTLTVFSRATQFLVFAADSGRLICAIDQHASGRIAVEAGEIVLIARCPFMVEGEPAGQQAVDAYIRYVDLRDTASVSYSGGTIELQATERPIARVVGARRIARNGDYRWIERPESVQVQYRQTDGVEAKGFLATLHHPSLNPDGVSVSLAQETGTKGLWTAPLQGVLPDSGDFGLLRVEIRRSGDTRVYLRDAVWIWPGLRQVTDDGVFDAASIPPNLDLDRCEHLSRTSSGFVLDDPSEGGYPAARFVFKASSPTTPEDPGFIIFEVPPPGVSLTLLDESNGEMPLRIGQSLALAADEHRRVIIRTPWPQSQLDIGGRVDKRSFTDAGSRTLSAAQLCENSDHRALRYRRDQTFQWQTLLTLIELEVPQRFEVFHTEHDSGFKGTFGRGVAAVRLQAYEVLHGEHRTMLLKEPPGLLQLSATGTEIQVHIRHSALADNGITVITPEIRFEGDSPDRWRTISSGRRDTYRWVTVGGRASVDGLISRVRDTGPAFLRVAAVLDQSVPQECWPSFEHTLVRAWERIGGELSRTEEGNRILLDAATRAWPQEYTPTWVPLLHPLRFAPRLFGQAPEAFRIAKDRKNRAEGAELLGDVSLLSGLGAREFLSSPSVRVEKLIGIAFTNAAKSTMGHIDLRRKRAALHQIVGNEPPALWNPQAPLLTQAHHSWCIARRFLPRLDTVLEGGQNTMRIRRLNYVAEAAAAHLHMIPYEEICFDVVESHRALPKLRDILFLLSLFARTSQGERPAYVAREIFKAIEAERSYGEQVIREEYQIVDSLTFLARLAPELLAFYILLWKLSAKGDSHA